MAAQAVIKSGVVFDLDHILKILTSNRKTLQIKILQTLGRTHVSPLNWAVLNGDTTMVRFLHHLKCSLHTGDSELGCLPIHLAAANGSLIMVERLFELGADLRAVDKMSQGALGYASMFDEGPQERQLIRKFIKSSRYPRNGI
jgi:ankyrin repeat protein